MKTTALPSDVAFADEEMPPTNEQVATTVGAEAYAPVSKVMQWLESAHPQLEYEWKFSKTSGWYEIPMLKGRRVFYFIPKHGGFLVNLLLGNKAIESLKNGPLARKFAPLLRNAKRYPEGTLFAFEPGSLEPDTFIALLRAKLAH